MAASVDHGAAAGPPGAGARDPAAYVHLLESVLDALNDSIEVTAADGSVLFRNRVARQHASVREAPLAEPLPAHPPPSDFIVSVDLRIPVVAGAAGSLSASGAVAPLPARLRVLSSIAAAHNPAVRRVLDTFPQLVWQNPTDAAADFVNRYWCNFTGVELESFGVEVRGLDWRGPRAPCPSTQPANPLLLPDPRCLPACLLCCHLQAWLETVHPDDHEASMIAWAEAQATGEPFRCAYRVRRHDGDWRWFLACATPIAGTRRWLGMAADITDQKRLQQELEDERALMLTTIGEEARAPCSCLRPPRCLPLLRPNAAAVSSYPPLRACPSPAWLQTSCPCP